MKKLILASKSKRRIAILASLNIEFKTFKTKNWELRYGLKAKDMVMVNALNKALEASKTPINAIIIAADTIIYKNGKMLGKPRTRKEAFNMLKLLRNNAHYVYTGIAIIDKYKKTTLVDYQKSTVIFRDYSHKEIYRYLAKEMVFDKAGGYNLGSLGALLYSNIHGCYYNILGLPLPKLENMLNHEGLSLFDFMKNKKTLT